MLVMVMVGSVGRSRRVTGGAVKQNTCNHKFTGRIGNALAWGITPEPKLMGYLNSIPFFTL
jgi:hypothetical protein